MKKINVIIIVMASLLVFTAIFSITGFYQLYVELNDEIGAFFISLSVVPVFVSIGIAIGATINDCPEENKNETKNR